MAKKAASKKRSFRSFVSIMTALVFLVLALTGIVLYIEPHGRVAFWTWWRFLGLSKGQWDGIHIILGWTFIVMAGLHTYLNWGPLVRYLRGRVAVGFRLRWELGLASALTVLLILGAALNLPPVSYLLELNERIKRSWVDNRADMPPFGHAEMKSLKVFCRIRRIDIAAAMTELKRAGVRVSSPRATIATIAQRNNITPAAVYKLIRKLEPPGMSRGRHRRGGGRGDGRP